MKKASASVAIAIALAIASVGSMALPAHAADGAVEKVTVKATVRFGFDQTALDAADQARILADVGKMKDVTWQSVTATGHTDALGPPGYNEKLSAKRADEVKIYLVGKGLEPAMISTAGTGAAQPVADNGSAAGRAKNRRTEIEFQGVRTAAK